MQRKPTTTRSVPYVWLQSGKYVNLLIYEGFVEPKYVVRNDKIDAKARVENGYTAITCQHDFR